MVRDDRRRGCVSAELSHSNRVLLIDERGGRLEAKRRTIPTTGTLGVLLEAQKRGVIDAEAAFQRLISETSLRATPAVRGTFVQQSRERTVLVVCAIVGNPPRDLFGIVTSVWERKRNSPRNRVRAIPGLHAPHRRMRAPSLLWY